DQFGDVKVIGGEEGGYTTVFVGRLNHDQFGDVKVIGGEEGGYTTVFVGRLNRTTNEDTLRKIEVDKSI
nr:U11/U12 small nuclear ribonucleoprotein 35 kDa protein [Tanacetum cinerariifolium]